MDKGLMIKELAAKIGITEDTVINWEIRGIKPRKRSFKFTNLLVGHMSVILI